MTQAHDWQPSASLAELQLRANILTGVRAFFADRHVLEVETPVLGAYGVTDPHIESITADGHWLRTSPEYHMKRLLAAGAPDIYQLAKVFRANERGRHHQPEFTMLEWYRHGDDLEALIAETCALLALIAERCGTRIAGPVRLSYGDAFQNACATDALTADAAELATAAERLLGGNTELPALGDDRQAWLDLLYNQIVQPGLPRDALVVIDGYPAPQAMLARLDPADPQVARRFEIFCNGLELANGFHELADAAEQAQRFAADNTRRTALGLPEMEPDARLLAALAAGLPDCCGVAVGIDRALQAMRGYPDITGGMSFAAGS